MNVDFDPKKFNGEDTPENGDGAGAGADDAAKKAAEAEAKAKEAEAAAAGAGGGGNEDDEPLDWETMQEALKKGEEGNEEDDEEKKKADEARLAAEAAASGGAGSGETEEEKKKREEAAAKLAAENKDKGVAVPKELYTELGVDEKEDATKLVESIKELKKKNEELMAKTQPSKLTKLINTLNEIVEYNDYDLMVKDFTVNKLSAEEAKKRADILKDNGMLVIEADKVRRGLKGYIAEKEAERQKEYLDSSSMSEKDLRYSKEALKSHAEKTETMFGFKVAKDAEGQKKVAKEHVDYITSGQMLRDMTASEQEIYENAWLIRNKKVIMKALTTRGVNQTKKEILTTLQNPDTGNKNAGRYHEPKEPGAFDPVKWMKE